MKRPNPRQHSRLTLLVGGCISISDVLYHHQQKHDSCGTVTWSLIIWR
jgi:hypothetical protein